MTGTIVRTVTIVSLHCGECHVLFGLNQSYHEAAKRDGTTFCCPNGHRIGYSDTEVSQLEREKAKVERQLQWAREDRADLRERLDHETRSKAAVKGHLTRTRRRVAAGVCPCCNRSFKDLARHMQGQHPEYEGHDRAAEPATP